MDSDRLKYELNPPLIVGEAMGKIITGGTAMGKVLEIRPDNRYKDGNIKIVDGKIRGNSRTVKVVRATPPQLGSK